MVRSPLFMLVLGCLISPLAFAQSWPTKPVRLMVNSVPGSAVDVVARGYASQLGDSLGHNMVVDNRPGAGGTIAIETVGRAEPDGYTFLASPGGAILMAPHVYKLAIDIDKDLIPVTPTARQTILLVARASLPARTVQELVAYARKHPNKLNFGSSGSGSSLHTAGEMLLHAAKIQATHIPFKGGAPALVALLGGETDFTFDPGPSIPHVKSGKLRLLAVARSTRSPFFPDTPTLIEAGFDVDMDLVQGLYAPAGTAKAIVNRLNREVGRIMRSPEMSGLLLKIGGEAVIATPQEFAERQRSERARYGKIMQAAGIRAD